MLWKEAFSLLAEHEMQQTTATFHNLLACRVFSTTSLGNYDTASQSLVVILLKQLTLKTTLWSLRHALA